MWMQRVGARAVSDDGDELSARAVSDDRDELRARAVTDDRDQLGEGPSWDEVAGELLRVDIARGLVHGWRPDDSTRSWTLSFAGEVSAAIPGATGGHVLAIGHDLVLRDADGGCRLLATVEQDRPDNRFNDCRCDRRGRLWAGTMSKRRTPGTAALYRLALDGALDRVVEATTLSNGLGWSPDGAVMYFIDSTTQRLDAFDFDEESGTVECRRALAEIDPADGLPDGLAVDAEGGVWIALFGGGALRRYDADGRLDAVIALPVTNPTCPTFGGSDLKTLYVTTARHRLAPEQLASEPLAGALLALEPGVRGLPANRFGVT
jgi:sugar lactone lactonase YvrE